MQAAVLDEVGCGAEKPSYGKCLLMCFLSTSLARGGVAEEGSAMQEVRSNIPSGLQFLRQMLSWNTV